MKLHILQLRVPLRGGITIARETIIDRYHVKSRHGVQLSVVTRIGGFVASLPRTAMDKHDDRIDALLSKYRSAVC
jgi:hypothetical protein